MVQRSLTFVLALAVAIAVPLPVLACALPMTECPPLAAPAEMPSQHCDTGMPAAPAGSSHDDDFSCCVLTAAPLPEASSKTEAPAPGATPEEVAGDAAVAFSVPEFPRAGISPPIVLSPDRQPVLCVFLI